MNKQEAQILADAVKLLDKCMAICAEDSFKDILERFWRLGEEGDPADREDNRLCSYRMLAAAMVRLRGGRTLPS